MARELADNDEHRDIVMKLNNIFSPSIAAQILQVMQIVDEPKCLALQEKIYTALETEEDGYVHAASLAIAFAQVLTAIKR